MENQPDLSTLTEQEKDALIITLFDVIESLRLQIRQQADEIAANRPQAMVYLSLTRKISDPLVVITLEDNKSTKVIILKQLPHQILLNLMSLHGVKGAQRTWSRFLPRVMKHGKSSIFPYLGLKSLSTEQKRKNVLVGI